MVIHLPYSSNPLVKPLIKFHNGWIKGRLLTPLPQEGKAAEIAKRIVLAIIAPFAYLALGFIASVPAWVLHTFITPRIDLTRIFHKN